jgi:hypothetical protein
VRREVVFILPYKHSTLPSFSVCLQWYLLVTAQTWTSTHPLINSLVTEVVQTSCPCAFFLTEHHATKAHWGSEGIAPHMLDLGTRGT